MKTDISNAVMLVAVGVIWSIASAQRFAQGDVWIGFAESFVAIVFLASFAGLLRDLCRKRPR